MVAHTGYLIFARKLAEGEAHRWRPREQKRYAGRLAALAGPVTTSPDNDLADADDAELATL